MEPLASPYCCFAPSRREYDPKRFKDHIMDDSFCFTCVHMGLLGPGWLMENSETLFRHALDITSSTYFIHYNLGAAYFRKGNTLKAIYCFEKAVRENMNNASAIKNLEKARMAQKKRTDSNL